MPLTLQFGAVSDIGRIRKKNDDSGYAGPYLIVVADGMGGAPAGDIASTVAIQTVKRLDVPPPPDLLQALAGTVLLANERLAEIIDEDPTVEGMGTTLTAALFDGAQIGVAHLGDSRGFLWRNGDLLRITRDHSWVQTLIDEGRITEEQAKTHSHRSLLLKVLDGRHDNEPDLSTFDVQAGDRILICSDGLTGFVDEARISQALAHGTAQSVAAELTLLALESGSTDNVTVLVGDVVETPEGASPAPVQSAPAVELDPDDTAVTLRATMLGPRAMIVGAAADRHRGPLTRLRTWAQRDEPEPSEILLDPSADPEELRYAPRAPRRFLWVRRIALILVALAVVAGGLTIAYQWTQTQYYVAADGDRVAIYRGVNADLPGVALSHVYQVQGLKLEDLPSFRRSQVMAGLAADSLAKAQRIVAQLRGFARICEHQSGTPTTTPTTMPPPPPAKTTPTGTTHGGKIPTNQPTTPTSTGTASPPGSTEPTTIGPPTTLVSPGGPGNVTECAGARGQGGSR